MDTRRWTGVLPGPVEFLESPLEDHDGFVRDMDLVGRLRDRGISTVGSLFWHAAWLQYPRHWISEEERGQLLKTVIALLEFYLINGFDIRAFQFVLAVKRPEGFFPAVNNPAGEPVFDPALPADQDALRSK